MTARGDRTPLPTMYARFREVAGDRVQPAMLSKATLTELSHTLENIVLELELPGTVLTGFQYSRNWARELARYERLVDVRARAVGVFASGNLPHVDEERLVQFDLPDEHPFRQEWFLLVMTDRFCAGLFGLDADADVEEEADRLFETVWSFDPAVVEALCDAVLEAAAALDPARARVVAEAVAAVPARRSDAAIETLFVQRMFQVLERARARHRAQLVEVLAAREDLRRAQDALVAKERLAAVGTLAAGVAHELNNPLTAIALAASLVGDDPAVPPAVREAQATVREQAARAGRIIRDLLAFVRQDDPVREHVDLGGLLASVLAETGRPGAEHVTVAGLGAEVALATDPDRLRLVLANLVGNALDADPSGRSVAVRVAASGADVRIEVRDDGPGIAEEVRGTLFDPFVSTKRVGQGTGLGLALAERFASELGGAVELVAPGPGGTVFAVRLPAGEGPPPEGSVTRDADADADADDVNADADPRRGRVLIVDDEQAIRALLGRLLERRGWEVTAVATGAEAAAAAEATRFDAVLLDLQLAGGERGVDVFERLGAGEARLRERCAFVTGALDAQDGQGVAATGRPVLHKPFSPAEVDALLADLVAA